TAGGGRQYTFGHVAGGRHIGAEAGISVVTGRASQGKRQRAGVGGEVADRNPVALVVLYGERHCRLLAGSAIDDLGQREVHAREGCRLVRDRVGSPDGGIELQFALCDVAVGALRIVHLGQVHVILAGGEVDIVVAGAAGRAVRTGDPVV